MEASSTADKPPEETKDFPYAVSDTKHKGLLTPALHFELNHHQYGLGHTSIDIHFHPSEYGILDRYSVVKEIYRVQLSPTIITLTTHKDTNLVLPFLLLTCTACHKKNNHEGQAHERRATWLRPARVHHPLAAQTRKRGRTLRLHRERDRVRASNGVLQRCKLLPGQTRGCKSPTFIFLNISVRPLRSLLILIYI